MEASVHRLRMLKSSIRSTKEHDEGNRPEDDLLDVDSRHLSDHVIYNYPARMVNQLQGRLLDQLVDHVPSAPHVLDPFVGSGTVMIEAMKRGYQFTGVDINPLSILICRTLARPLVNETLEACIEEVRGRLSKSNRGSMPSFNGLEYWFTPEMAVQLSRLRHAISQESSATHRRFLWVAFAETAREASLMRSKSYKLHRRSEIEDPFCPSKLPATFVDNAMRAAQRMGKLRNLLDDRGLISNGCYKPGIRLHCSDIRTARLPRNSFNLVMTSPPYGDNKTTVPYGQHSYLGLSWIPKEELPIHSTHIDGPCTLDTASLGGRRTSADAERALFKASPFVRRTSRKIQSIDARKRFVSFALDFCAANERIEGLMAPDSIGVWTLGDRTLSGHQVSMAELLFAASTRQEHVYTLKRKIPRKRMPSRNATSPTINREDIVVTWFRPTEAT